MRWRSLGVLALLLAVAAGAYYALEAKGKKSEDAKQLFQADEKDIEKISIKRGEEHIVMTREGTGWRLTEPVQAKAETSEITSLLQTLLSAKEERTIDEQPKSLGEYGLEHPTIQITVGFKSAKPPLVLLVGDKNPNGFSAYAKRGDQLAVFLVADTVRTRLDRKASDFRDKRLLVLEPDKVKQVDLVSAGRSISLSNAGAEKWELTQPIKAKADAAAVRQLLWSIKDARVREFLASGTDAKRRYGLDHPDLTIAVKEGDASKRLLLKKAPEPNVGLYAMADPGEGIVTTESRLLTDLSKSPLDLRNRSLLRFETTDVKGVQLRRAGQSLTLTKEKDVWKVTAPIQADAQAGKVYESLYSLKELRYTDLVTEKATDLGRYGLKTPQAEVELNMNDGSRLPVLRIGTSEKERLYAKLSTDPAVYAIDPKFLDRLPKDPDVLKQQTTSTPGK
ncbi:MAG: DUF4340 domain-containing protein [candidate division NC10 bacterium]|nr:DUF4340 domain-containing protein [candidate division NC10 bacterium]